MSDEATVWVVTTGEYSAYEVNSIWPTKELADAYAERLGTGYYSAPNEPFEMPVRTTLPNPLTYFEMTGRWPEDEFYVSVRERGAVRNDGWDDDLAVVAKAVPIASETGIYASQYGDKSHIDLRVWGTDAERVAKVFSEKFAQIKADFDVLVEAKRRELDERDRHREAFTPVRVAMVAEAGRPVDYMAMLNAFDEAGEDPDRAMEIIRAAGFPPEPGT